MFSGLCTGIGSLIAFFAKKTNTKFLSFSLGLSAGVMIYVSTIELFPEANGGLVAIYGKQVGTLITVAAFFGGMFLITLIDKLLPSDENPHEVRFVENMSEKDVSKRKLMKTGVLTALAIAIHNFPEGISTFMSSMTNIQIAIPIVAAVAIHNIPEGISVSVPIYYATGSKKKAFLLSFASGLSEPLGAILTYLILMPFLNDTVFGIIIAAVAGIMVFISLDELLPSAEEYGEHHISIYGVVTGMIIMALSLIIL